MANALILIHAPLKNNSDMSIPCLYNSTPYNDDASMKGGWIVFFVQIGALVFVWFVCLVPHMPAPITIRPVQAPICSPHCRNYQFWSMAKKLTPEVLDKEFSRVDTKEEMRAFMGGEVKEEQDFNIMFAAIDLDRNNTIEFSEFCASMGQMMLEGVVATRRASGQTVGP